MVQCGQISHACHHSWLSVDTDCCIQSSRAVYSVSSSFILPPSPLTYFQLGSLLITLPDVVFFCRLVSLKFCISYLSDMSAICQCLFSCAPMPPQGFIVAPSSWVFSIHWATGNTSSVAKLYSYFYSSESVCWSEWVRCLQNQQTTFPKSPKCPPLRINKE